jgi:hypothetical protein
MTVVTGTRKLALTAVMFVIALGMLALAAVTKVTAPLFAAWAPLLVVPYVLTRREPGEEPPAPPSPDKEPASEDAPQDRSD